MTYFWQFLFLIITYFVASIPFGLLLAKKYAGKDVRASGSGNIGATNVARVVGKKLGALTLLLDALKGMVMIICARYFFYDVERLHLLLVLVAAVAVIGHVYPIYLKFKGGKGVATTIAVIIALDPTVGFLTIMMWIMVFLMTRMSAVASIAGALSMVLLSIHFDALKSQVWLCVFLLVLITIRHRENIIRIMLGEENKM